VLAAPGVFDALREAIRHMHGVARPAHVEIVPVRETFQGQVVWDSEAQLFDVTGRPPAGLVARHGRR
jgi:hypothetical protein